MANIIVRDGDRDREREREKVQRILDGKKNCIHGQPLGRPCRPCMARHGVRYSESRGKIVDDSPAARLREQRDRIKHDELGG